MGSLYEMHREVKRGNIARVEELVSGGAKMNDTDPTGWTPLMYALRSSAASVELVRLLLDHGGVVVPTRYEVASLGAFCLRGGDPRKLTLVLDRGEDLQYTRDQGYTAIMDAVFSENAGRDPRLLEVLRILIAHGVPLNGVSSYGESALRVLSRLGRFDAVQLLLQAGADESQLAWSPLHRAVALGTLADVKGRTEAGESLESRDWWERTPWLVAVKTGDLEKARYLVDRGADWTVTGRGGVSPLDLAIESFQVAMLQWLIDLGISVESGSDCCATPLMTAVRAGYFDAVDMLIRAGADVNRHTRCGCALRDARTREVTLRLLDAGADPGDLSNQGRRAILGLEPDASHLIFDATPEDFRAAPGACWGEHNPELMNFPFWQAMIRSGLSAYAGAQLVGGTPEDSPVWCADRFGQSLTLLPDGRVLQIGGEHEDFYDSDFCIYNDVSVHYPDGHIDIFGYPEDVFAPTDFHTATLIGDSVWMVGGLGYQGSRRFGETPVYCLDIDTFQIRRIETTGEPPGWISRHRAALIGPHAIRVWGGKIAAEAEGQETYDDNHRSWIFDTEQCRWQPEAESAPAR